MPKAKSAISGIAMLTVITFAVASVAFAAPQTRHNKRLSYEDAWAVCKKFVDDAKIAWDQSGHRYSRGASCMRKYG